MLRPQQMDHITGTWTRCCVASEASACFVSQTCGDGYFQTLLKECSTTFPMPLRQVQGWYAHAHHEILAQVNAQTPEIAPSTCAAVCACILKARLSLHRR